jgi:phosphatidylserine synthase
LRPADAATLAGGLLAGASIPLSISGHMDAAVRLLMLAYFFDVIDGWLARRFGGSTPEGLMLDRAFDRVSQIIAPLTLYLSWVFSGATSIRDLILLSIYAGGIVAVAFWRLVRRIVWSLTHFAGLPMFVHAGVLITSYLAHVRVNPLVLVGLMLASAVPVPYVRRISKSGGTPSPGVSIRAAIVLLFAVIPYNNAVVIEASKVALGGLLLYAATGFLPPLLGLTPGGRSGLGRRVEKSPEGVGD